MTTPSTRAGGPVLEIRDLAVSYGGVVQALRGVSLTVHEGTVVALLGSNGAGKTTLLRTLSGTLGLHRGRVDRGEVIYRGADLVGRDAAKCVASGPGPGSRGTADLHPADGRGEPPRRRAGRSGTGRERAADDQRIYDLFPVLAERRTQRAGLLSGGEQQMLAIGRGLMARPQLLLLDEPSLGPRAAHHRTDRRGHPRDQPPGHLGPAGRAERDDGPRCRRRPPSSSTSGGVAVGLRRRARAQSDAVQRLYLGHGADGAPSATRRGCRHQDAHEVVVSESARVSRDLRADVRETSTVDERHASAFGAVKALSGRVVHGRARRRARDHRPQRRRQVDDVQRPVGRLPGVGGRGTLRRHRARPDCARTRSPASASPGPSRTSRCRTPRRSPRTSCSAGTH